MCPFGEATTFSSLQRCALSIDLPTFLLITAEEAAIQTSVMDYMCSMALFILPGRASRCSSKFPSFMNDGSWSYSPFPLLMDVADANITFKGV